MADAWMPGLNHDPGRSAGYNAGRCRMQFVVHHDTAGANSYNICKWGRPGYNAGLCQILLPKEGVPWQFCEIDALSYHAGSQAYGDFNPFGPGFEVERLGHQEALSPDQVRWLGEIHRWMAAEWGVPNVQYRGPQYGASGWHGHVNHSDLHPNPDGLTYPEWDTVTGASAPGPGRPQGENPDMIYQATDNGKVLYFREAQGYLLLLAPEVAAAFYGKCPIIDLGGILSVLAWNNSTKAQVAKASA
jgi:hypothetical protein